MQSLFALLIPLSLIASEKTFILTDCKHLFPILIASTLISLAFIIYSIYFIIKSRSIETDTGMEEMIGLDAKVIAKTEDGYLVKCHSETWEGVSDIPLEINQIVKVDALAGLLLHLKPKE
ncbi:MAG: hypothetical protein J7J31_04705 [Helicobacteraceae bacterium]|nr:hypothetical protein [Helicobacteraceae bacterium]